ncbi:MAG: hypothetical protein E6942_16380, partial [Clostridium argentinense]|nr:hypothetical protein [Clostridium argentinense]
QLLLSLRYLIRPTNKTVHKNIGIIVQKNIDINKNTLVRYKSKQFIEILKNARPIEKFDMDLFFRIIEKVMVFEGEKIIVSLLDGTEVEVVIE